MVLTGPPSIGGVVVPRALIARCSLRLLLQIVREPAKFIRDVRRTEGEIAQRSCRLAEKFGQIFWHVRLNKHEPQALSFLHDHS